MRWTTFDRALCISGALLGMLAFAIAVWGMGDPRRPHFGWQLPLGIICLVAGLSVLPLILWRSRR